MYCKSKDDRTVIDALKLANNGHHTQAARMFQDAGNQERNPAEKKALWDAAERSRRIANSD
jgi:hypothetical protein